MFLFVEFLLEEFSKRRIGFSYRLDIVVLGKFLAKNFMVLRCAGVCGIFNRWRRSAKRGAVSTIENQLAIAIVLVRARTQNVNNPLSIVPCETCFDEFPTEFVQHCCCSLSFVLCCRQTYFTPQRVLATLRSLV